MSFEYVPEVHPATITRFKSINRAMINKTERFFQYLSRKKVIDISIRYSKGMNKEDYEYRNCVLVSSRRFDPIWYTIGGRTLVIESPEIYGFQKDLVVSIPLDLELAEFTSRRSIRVHQFGEWTEYTFKINQ